MRVRREGRLGSGETRRQMHVRCDVHRCEVGTNGIAGVCVQYKRYMRTTRTGCSAGAWHNNVLAEVPRADENGEDAAHHCKGGRRPRGELRYTLDGNAVTCTQCALDIRITRTCLESD